MTSEAEISGMRTKKIGGLAFLSPVPELHTRPPPRFEFLFHTGISAAKRAIFITFSQRIMQVRLSSQRVILLVTGCSGLHVVLVISRAVRKSGHSRRCYLVKRWVRLALTVIAEAGTAVLRYGDQGIFAWGSYFIQPSLSRSLQMRLGSDTAEE